MDPLYIVDGSGYIFRAYYAVPHLSNSEGFPTNALHGFTRMLKKLLNDVNARFIAVTFDTGAPTFRHELYPEYKANRGDCPEDLVPQMPYFREIVKAFGIACLEKEGFEADDIIGTLVERFKSPEREIVVVSGDKDLTQLVQPGISIWDAMRDIRYDSDKVEEKFGVRPEQIVDYLALRGDSSDNIPGVKGVGEKTAATLIQKLGSVENILSDPGKIEEIDGLRGKAGVRKKVEAGLDGLELSKKLVSLDLNVEPFASVVDIEEFRWKGPELERLEPLATELEFEFQLPSPDGEIVQSNGNLAGDSEPEANQSTDETVLLSKSSFDSFVEELKAKDTFAFDTETTSLDPLDGELLGISISWDGSVGYYLPLGSAVEPEALLDKAEVLHKIGPIFSDSKVKKVGLNLKYDVRVLGQHGYDVQGVSFDVLLASHLFSPDRRGHGLKYLTKTILDQEMKTYEETVGDLKDLSEVPLAEVASYAAHDARASWSLYKIFEERFLKESNQSLFKLFNSIEMPLVKVLSRMEDAGVEVDSNFLDELDSKFSSQLVELEKRILELAGVEFNLNSPKQLSKVLFEDLGIPTKGVKKTKTGYSTDARVLSSLAKDHQIVAELLDYRELFKLKTTYVDALKRLKHPKTGRIHSTFNQAIAATGRLSSSDPNLQNIPIKNERGRLIRQAFICSPGNELISADYSQIELRVLAHLSDDKNLKRAFQEGEDIHLRTAKEIFGELLSEEELADLRRVAKTINFGIVYGMSGFRLSRELKIPKKQADEYIEGYFDRYPNVRKYFETLDKDSTNLGYVETLFGRRRFADQIDSSGRDSGYVRRSLLNAPIQGTAAEIIKLAMIKLDNRFGEYRGKAKIIMQVHDELVIEAEKSLAPEIEAIIVSEMESATQLNVPLKVDVRRSDRWSK